LYAKLPKTRKVRLRLFRKVFLQSTDVLEVIDKGSGSQHFKSASRNVKDIAKYAGMPWHKAKLINKIISYLNIKTALELGTSVGLGSLAMAVNHTKSQIDTVEACPNTSAYAIKKYKELDLKNIRVFNYDFSFFLNNISQNKAYDLIYLDGNHNKASTLEYFDLIQKHIHAYSLVILDDIYWSNDMQEAWQVICNHESVKVSIDLYFWGIIFFNPDLSKQHYKIRCFF
jgi:predicted O-methyltransferase YrrM